MKESLKLRFFFLFILIIFLSIRVGIMTHARDDANENDVNDEIDLETLVVTTSDTHVRFSIQCYNDIDTDKKNEPKDDFVVFIDVYEGVGDDKNNHPFQGADFAVEAQEGKVYHWDGKNWKEDKSASVQVEIDGRSLSLTCLIDDVDLDGGSGNPEIGYLSHDKKISGKKSTKISQTLHRMMDGPGRTG